MNGVPLTEYVLFTGRLIYRVLYPHHVRTTFCGLSRWSALDRAAPPIRVRLTVVAYRKPEEQPLVKIQGAIF